MMSSFTLHRSFFISIFEISSERGKGERLFDLSPNGGDLSMQQSTLRGLQEVEYYLCVNLIMWLDIRNN